MFQNALVLTCDGMWPLVVAIGVASLQITCIVCQALLERTPAAVQRLGLYAQVASNHRKAVIALGLQHHHVLSKGGVSLQCRHPVYAKVIYHSDSWTLYGQAPPTLVLVGHPNWPAEDPQLDIDADNGGADAVCEAGSELALEDEAGGEVAFEDDILEPAAPHGEAPSQKSLDAIWGEHFLLQPVLTKHLLQHLQQCLQGEASGFFGAPLRPPLAFQSLVKRLFPQQSGEVNFAQA